MKWQKVFSFIYVSFCFVGCSYQLIEVFKSYFSFNIISKVVIEFPAEINIPSFSSCFRFPDIMDLRKFNSKYKQKIVRNHGIVSDGDIRLIQSMITKKDIFELTPNENQELFWTCLTRSNLDYSLQKNNGSACRELFHVTRFIIDEFVCFMMEPSKILKYSKNRISSSLSYPNVLYYVTYNWKLFNISQFMKLVVHSAGSPPFTSVGLVNGFWRRTKFESIPDDTYFQMDYSLIKLNLLPFPYTTACKNYSRNACLKNCTKVLSVESFNKIPFSVIGTNPTDLGELSFIDHQDLANESFVQQLTTVEFQCLTICDKPSCTTDFSLTNNVKAHSQELKFEVDIPVDPFVEIKNLPQMNFNDFLILSLSLLGFWLGLSISNLNPKYYFSSLDECLRWKRSKKKKEGKKGNKLMVSKQKRGPIENGSMFCLETRLFLRERADDEISFILTALNGPSMYKPFPVWNVVVVEEDREWSVHKEQHSFFLVFTEQLSFCRFFDAHRSPSSVKESFSIETMWTFTTFNQPLKVGK